MATISSFSSLNLICRPKYQISQIVPCHSLTLPRKSFQFQTELRLKCDQKKRGFGGLRILRSSEEETLVTETEQESEEGGQEESVASDEQQPVAVPVSALDKLTMFFQADGIMNEAAIPNMTKALEGTEGISDLKVLVLEGIATVELKKQTTVQSTGVAASLVEIIQGSGFKLQTLNLSFEDEEDVVLA
ncbi:hypothetical protein LWI28_019533 [Acer negundo]|uniref:HMA domain-containing protein n=1 Tax=Acer negundo TaxID=4023 RepID=A0AAD5I9N1_ACENE|nr:hypothetical protein LWI28_019533 [Acer negundo]KAK4833477.1 hypothetical protein QYF36_005636 [Acer negundo]